MNELDSAPVKVSVVIPCFNHGEFLPEALASVSEARREDVQVIVVDDGSTDDRTQAEIDKLAGRKDLYVIRQQNKGLAAARNAGIAASRGQYILPLDADNRIRPAYLERGIPILDSNSRVGVVYGDAEYIGSRAGRWKVDRFDSKQLLGWNFIDACAMYRRVIWEQNGGYDGDMPVQGYEDWDFWLGALENGWEFVKVREVMFEYRTSPSSMITRARGFEREVQSYVARKHSQLYYQGWRNWLDEEMSITRTTGKLAKLVHRRVKRRLGFV